MRLKCSHKNFTVLTHLKTWTGLVTDVNSLIRLAPGLVLFSFQIVWSMHPSSALQPQALLELTSVVASQATRPATVWLNASLPPSLTVILQLLLAKSVILEHSRSGRMKVLLHFSRQKFTFTMVSFLMINILHSCLHDWLFLEIFILATI